MLMGCALFRTCLQSPPIQAARGVGGVRSAASFLETFPSLHRARVARIGLALKSAPNRFADIGSDHYRLNRTSTR